MARAAALASVESDESEPDSDDAVDETPERKPRGSIKEVCAASSPSPRLVPRLVACVLTPASLRGDADQRCRHHAKRGGRGRNAG